MLEQSCGMCFIAVKGFYQPDEATLLHCRHFLLDVKYQKNGESSAASLCLCGHFSALLSVGSTDQFEQILAQYEELKTTL